MRRGLLHACLIAALLGSISTVVAELATRPAREATSRANKLLEEAHDLMAEGKREASWAAVDEALTIDPRNLTARRERAMRNQAFGRYREAADELVAVAEAQPWLAGAAWEAASALDAAHDMPSAHVWAERVIALKPYHGLAHVLLARCLLQVGDAKGAVKEAEAGVHFAPRVVAAYLALGLARVKSGDPAGAKAAVTDALALQPSDVNALLYQCQICTLLNQRDEAAHYAAKARAAARNDPAALAAIDRILGR